MGAPRFPGGYGRGVTQPRMLSAAEANKVLGIPAPTVRTWYHRRERTGLYPVGFDRRGHPRFREDDLLRLRKGHGHRRGPTPGPADLVVGSLDRLLTAHDAQQVLGIPASTVTTWHHRRLQTGLYSRAYDERRPLFYESDLIALRCGQPVRDAEGNRIYSTTGVDE